ncbi:MAG: DUF6602 domain-containing protein [Chthoniobacteraceae bacterium]
MKNHSSDQEIPQTEDMPGSAQFLRDAFATEQECLVAKLKSSARIVHAGDRGEVNEQHFIDFLRKYLPNRYTVEKAIILDCDGKVSQSIDVVVFDRQYTPTLLDNDKHRYVPAEAVYAVFECKPTIDKGYLEYAADKAASVRQLKRTSVAIHHAGGVFPPKKLFPIVAGILAINVGWTEGLGGESFQRIHRGLIGDRSLDCGFAATGASFDIFDDDGSYTLGPSDNALAFFAFRLLGKLQSLATVPAVDWIAYANQLSRP